MWKGFRSRALLPAWEILFRGNTFGPVFGGLCSALTAMKEVPPTSFQEC